MIPTEGILLESLNKKNAFYASLQVLLWLFVLLGIYAVLVFHIVCSQWEFYMHDSERYNRESPSQLYTVVFRNTQNNVWIYETIPVYVKPDADSIKDLLDFHSLATLFCNCNYGNIKF